MTNGVIVIGSGLGGLLAGYLLSKEGLHVTLLEKHRKFGGCLQSFKRDMFTFDTGMHYIGSMSPGQPLYRYWKYFGLTDRLELLKMDPDGFDRISFAEDRSPLPGWDFPLAQGMENFREQLLPLFPDAGTILKDYTEALNRIARSHSLYDLELQKGPGGEAFSDILVDSFLQEVSSGFRHQGSGIPLADILAGNNFLYAGNPLTTPLSQFGLINHSFISSAWRLAGGSQQVADILVDGIRSNGGEVLAKKKVTSVRKEGVKFQVLAADGERFEAGRVISDIHPATTLQLLDGIPVQKAYRERICHLSNTLSVFTVYLGLKAGSFPFMNHNVYHHLASDVWTDTRCQMPDTKSNILDPESGIRDPGWPWQFLFMTPPERLQGPSARTAIIMSPMRFQDVAAWEKSDSGAREKAYFVFKAKRARMLLEAVYRKYPGLKEAVVTIDISTPLTWRDYTGTPQGSMYGVVKVASNLLKTSVFPKTKVPGLFFTGQSVNLHGALGVTIGAVMTCGEVLGLPYVLKAVRKDA